MDFIYEKKPPIAYLTINRPEKMNSLSAECWQEMPKVFTEVDSDPAIRVGIVTGAGEKAFSSGDDLTRHVGPQTQTGEFWRPYRASGGSGLFGEREKPWIAAINGYCLAGGLELALSCDIRIASENASFGAAEILWARIFGFGTLKLVRTLPLSSAMEIILTGDRIDAKEAYRIGLVSRMVPLAELMPTAERIATRISENGPVAVKVAKELAIKGRDMSFEDGLRYLGALRRILDFTEDSKEGPRAFVEKRKPVYKGR